MTVSADRRRVAWGYEPNTPLCCNCVGYRKATIGHDPETGAVKTIVPAFCTKGRFTVVANGCCNKWSNRNGERIA